MMKQLTIFGILIMFSIVKSNQVNEYSFNITTTINMSAKDYSAKSIMGVVGTVLCAPSVPEVLGVCGSEMKVVLDALKGFPIDNLLCCLFAKFRICLRDNTVEDCSGNSFVGRLFGPTFGQEASKQIDDTITGLTQDLDVLAEMCYEYNPMSDECTFILNLLLNFYTIMAVVGAVLGLLIVSYVLILRCALTKNKIKELNDD